MEFKVMAIETDYCFMWNDHWELYDPEKEYTKGVFTANYRGIEKKYKYIISSVLDTKYVISREQISEEERTRLAPFCQCTVCKSWTNFFINTNGSCLNCLTCDNADPTDETIKMSRIAYLKSLK